MENRKRHTKRLFTGLSAAMFLTQTICSVFTLAEQLTFDGTTQLDTDSCYLDVDSVSLQLEIEEIYIQEGSQISQGDQILKLTEDSYQEALDDYAAAIIRADNQLTDVQLEYDQGILESGYTYDTARTKAEQAEFVKEYQEKELADTIENYEEALENLEDRIAELESGISAGSYASGNSSGGSGGSGSSSSSGSFGDQKGEEKESETEPESDGMGSKPGETETEAPGAQPGGTETETPGTQSGGMETETPGAQPGETETETPGTQPGETETETPGAQPGEAETETPGAQPGETETETPSASGNYKELEEKIAERKTLLNENMEEYEALLGRLEELGLKLTDSSDTSGQEESSQETVSSDASGELLGDSIQGNKDVKTNLENVQKNLEEVVTDDLLNAVKSVNEEYYKKYDDYKKLLESLIRQLDADIKTQQAVQSVLGSDPETENSSLDEAALQEVIAGLKENAAQRSEIYNQLILLQEEWISGLQKDLEESSKPGETEQKPGETEQKPDETEQKPGETEQRPGGTEQKPGETEQQPGGTQQQPGETEQPNGNGTFPQNGENTGSLPSGGFSMPSGGSSASAPSMASGGAASAGTMTGSGGTVSGSSGMQMNGNISESDISLFGNTYDLTQVNSLLEREPSGTEDAQELLEQLEESRDTVEEQYSELIRERRVTELGIQYTYDTSVIEGKLAEFTYQEELQEWEETLAEAKQEKETLEEDKAILDSMPDGILLSDRDGTVADISYETGDIINSQEPIISFYHTDTLTVTIQVPQESIAEFSVGDTVTVTVNGRMKREGTVTEKASEPVDGTSRTAVQYEVTISLDNSDGMLSSGLAATVSLQDTKTADQESENEEE